MTPERVDGLRRLVRRAPLIVVMLLLAWVFLGDRPREITLVYDIPDEPAPARVDVRLVDREGRVPAAITWGTGSGAAADRQPHHARLAPGDYRLEATLEFAGGRRREVARGLSVSAADEQIVVHLR